VKPYPVPPAFTGLAGLAGVAARFIATTGRARSNHALFDAVEACCTFVGYPRSGHTLVGALLDAHRHTVIGFEQAALLHVRAGFDRDRLYQMLLDSATRGGPSRWVSGPYHYHVPGQWQGRFDCLRIIGDKQAEGATLRLRAAPRLLTRLQRLVRQPRFVHVVRNPFDNITTIAIRAAHGGSPDLDSAADRYFRLSDTVRWITTRTDPGQVLTIRHEDFVHDPRRELAVLCAWLGLDSPPDYLDDCAAIVRDRPNPSRLRVPWSRERIESVQRRIDAFNHLRGYSFES
jgi:hypothetical protein